MISKTSDYDPRYDHAQTIKGAKARYVEADEYTLSDFEKDVERLLREGEHPDKPPLLEGQPIHK